MVTRHMLFLFFFHIHMHCLSFLSRGEENRVNTIQLMQKKKKKKIQKNVVQMTFSFP
jgi:hypothetical protein